jgi:diaminopimelate decarboxylase
MTGPVTGFHQAQSGLACDGVGLREIAAAIGTPTYVYSAGLIDERYRRLDAAYARYPHRLHYAIKANATGGIVRRLRQLGAAADANSGGEIEVALRAGFAPGEIVFTGVGKTRGELERAVGLDVAAINAESPGEVDRIEAIARIHGRRARVAVRINPDVDALSHPHISTGLRATKFGMSLDDARAMVLDMAHRPDLAVVGLHVHVGSQITSPAPLERAADVVASLARELIRAGVRLEHLDLGGGLGIAYEPDQPVVTMEEYAEAVLPAVRSTGLTLVLEPGRAIVGPAGVLVTEVVDLKRRPDGGWFVVTDAGMTDLLRPALYGAWHAIEPVCPRPGAHWRVDVVGPVCETSDTLGTDRELSPVDVGDLLAVRDVGAYGAVMASNYNRRPTAAEVLASGGTWDVIRRRQTVDDMLMWDA